MSNIDIMSILNDYATELEVHYAILEGQRDVLLAISKILFDIDNRDFAEWY